VQEKSSTFTQSQQEKRIMTSKFFNLSVKAGRIDAQQVRLALAIGTLMLFVLGAGAPFASGNG
jgi:hypothetical protein